MTRKVFGIDRGLQRGQQHVRPDIAGDEIDLVGLDQLFGLLLADVRLLAVVLVDHFDRHAAHLAAHMIERELERIAHVVADHSGRAAEGRDKADLDGVRRDRGLRQRQSRDARQPECLFHIRSPSCRYRSAVPCPVRGRTPRSFGSSCSGDVFCARNCPSAASTEPRSRLEPSAHARGGCTIIRSCADGKNYNAGFGARACGFVSRRRGHDSAELEVKCQALATAGERHRRSNQNSAPSRT